MTDIYLDGWADKGTIYVIGSAFKDPMNGKIHQRSTGIPYINWRDVLKKVKDLMSPTTKIMTGYQEAPEFIRIYKVDITDVTKDCDILIPMLVKKKLLK